MTAFSTKFLVAMPQNQHVAWNIGHIADTAPETPRMGVKKCTRHGWLPRQGRLRLRGDNSDLGDEQGRGEAAD